MGIIRALAKSRYVAETLGEAGGWHSSAFGHKLKW